jgi:23S rRNA (uracil747-C5)-methyltransferase
MGQPYSEQLGAKAARARELLAPFGPRGAATQWLPPIASAENGFRAKAKMVVGGTVDAPTLGILDGAGRGVDLRHCGIIAPGILAAFPTLIAAITRVRLTPYDVPTRTGELKHLIVTEAASGDLMVRFVVRGSEAAVASIRNLVPWLQDALPRIVVVTANIHPEHKAVLEGEVEHVLTAESTLRMRVGDIDLHVLPRSFVQTNTPVAGALYRQARDWVDELDPASVWDLYCGVGGFALHVAGVGGGRGVAWVGEVAGVGWTAQVVRSVVGVEASADAVASAELARDAQYSTPSDRGRIRFITADATAFAVAAAPAVVPELVIVNPPRRGLGTQLANWLQRSGPQHVIYSSCNVESLARDLAAMPAYRVERARVLDMFPQSTHCEVITLLARA